VKEMMMTIWTTAGKTTLASVFGQEKIDMQSMNIKATFKLRQRRGYDNAIFGLTQLWSRSSSKAKRQSMDVKADDVAPAAMKAVGGPERKKSHRPSERTR
jgi:hypothetical protein